MNPSTVEGPSLTVEYALIRSEIFRSFVYGAIRSPKYLTTLLLYSLGVGVLTQLVRATILQSFTLMGVVDAVAWGLGFLVFIAVWTYIRGKTAKRTLTVSRAGIFTEIGRIKAQIPWEKVRVVTDTRRFVLIARTNGNAFFVPHRAFSGAEQRGQFVSEIRNWMRADTKQM